MLATVRSMDRAIYGIIYLLMGKYVLVLFLFALVGSVQASWYWPFGSDEDEEKDPPRLSTLMEPASLLIDEASDLAADGKVDESVEKYRKALVELDRIEAENPERAKTSEFSTVRNKRAYVNAAIDSMLLSQVKSNAKAVAVSDTAELERKLAEERGIKAKPKAEAGEVRATNSVARIKPAAPTTPSAKPKTKRDQAIDDIVRGDFAAADILIREMLASQPKSVLALNLKATMEVRQGKFKEAEATLDQAIASNPRNYHAYYNMALLMLQRNPDAKDAARRYYETGREMGNGPKNEQLEALLK